MNPDPSLDSTTPGAAGDPVKRLAANLRRRAPLDAAELLRGADEALARQALQSLPPAQALRILMHVPEEKSRAWLATLGGELTEQWTINRHFDKGTVGWLMEPAVAVFPPEMTVQTAIERVRELAAEAMFTYAYVCAPDDSLQGVVVMRDLLLARPEERLDAIMVPNPFFFQPETLVNEAVRSVLHRHYPAYPVCDARGRLLGLVQGYALFEEQADALSAQAGALVGVEREEHVGTAFPRSLAYRQPWLQLNLLTAFLAAFVVGLFDATIEKIVVLAAFLPVLAGQSGNTGLQALAVTLRGITLNEFKPGMVRGVLLKELGLGLSNGLLTGLVAGGAMYWYALQSQAASPLTLAAVVAVAMMGSCTISGVTGVLVPLIMKRLGADPATASGIFLTTMTDVASMGMMLGLATVFVL